MDRAEELEDLLECQILHKVKAGESLEKYHAILDDRPVLLRIYGDDYYSNRFLREGLALRSVRSSDLVKVPKIIDEWPEYQIRAIEWIDFDEDPIHTDNVKQIRTWLDTQDLSLPYDLAQDLVPHLLNVEDLHIAYQDWFVNIVDQILELIDWTAGKHQLLHGDFHLGNLAKSDGQIVVYDWEYATMGSSYYDLAYLSVLNPELSIYSIPLEWEILVSTIIAHWYLQEDQFSPKASVIWVDRISNMLKEV